MHYSLMIYQTSAHFADRTDAERRDANNAALAWAARMPFEHCAAVEVRPTRMVPMV